MSDREEWMTTYLEAYVWWCGDEVCDCHQPVIERLTPNIPAGYPWIRRERLWEGTFQSGEYDSNLARRELRKAARNYGLEVNEMSYCREAVGTK